MSIFHIVALAILVYAIFNYKRAVLVFLVFSVFLNPLINIVNIPGVPLLTMKSFMGLYFVVLYYMRGTNLTLNTPFPLRNTYSITTISYIISLLLGIVSFGVGFGGFAKVLLEQFFTVWLIWLNVSNIKDLKFLGISYLFIFTIASVYGIIEHQIEQNPLTLYEMQFAGDNEEKIIDYTYSSDYGRGYRIKSIFYHAIGASFNFAIYIMFCMYFMMKWGKKIKVFTIISLALSIVAIVYTNSRTPFAFLLICLIPFFSGSNNLRLLLLGTALIIIAFIDKDSNLYRIFLSFFDKKTSEDLGGSTITAREDQFDATFSILMESPLWGLGPKSTSLIATHKDYERLLGLESIWIWTAIERGLIGMGALAFYYFTLVRLIKRNLKMVFLVFAYIFTVSATSIPGSYDELLFVILFAHIKKINS